MPHQADGDICKIEWHHQSPAHSKQPEALDPLLVLHQDTQGGPEVGGFTPLKSDNQILLRNSANLFEASRTDKPVIIQRQCVEVYQAQGPSQNFNCFFSSQHTN